MSSVLIFCKTYLKGGAEKQALTLANLLSEMYTSVLVVGWNGDEVDAANKSLMDAGSLRYFGLKGNPVRKILEVNRIIRREKVSVVLAYLTLANFVSGICRLFNRDLKTIGGIRTEQFPFYKLVFERFVHNHLNDVTVFNNHAARLKFEAKGFNADKIQVIHNSIKVPARNNDRQPTGEIRIVSVCRFVRPKDFHTALNSFRELKLSNRNIVVKYYLAGYGPMEDEIRSMVAELELGDNVVLKLNPSGIPDMLGSCDIYLSTSLFEGLSNSIMEAMAAGLPVIATDVGDSGYLVRDGYNGFLVRCRDIKTIAEKLGFLAVNEDVRKEFGKRSYSLISKEFSEDKLIRNYLDLLDRLGIQPER